MGDQAPHVDKITNTTANVAAGATDSFAIGEVKYAGTVTAVSYLPDGAATGDTTNTRTYTLVNKGSAGAGTTVVATLALITSVNLVAFDEKAFTLSAVEGATTVAAGDVLALVSTYAASGLADPGGTIQVEITRSA
jgi:hypothetical protein